MRIIAILLVIFLITKDTSHLNDRFIMRGIGQGLWLAVGIIWIIMNFQRVRWSRYSLLGAYIFVILMSAYFSMFPVAVLIQIVSLLSVLLFSIAATSSKYRSSINSAIIITTLWGYLFVCVVSLALIKVAPNIAYQVGDIAGDIRFAGLYNRPAMMGAASGILFGIAVFGNFRRRHFMDAVRIIAGLAGLSCLLLCGSRTFWIAAIIAMAITAYKVFRIRARFVFAFAIFALIGFLTVQIANITITKDTEEKALRIESVSTLTGRTKIWNDAFTALRESPLLGFGFGVGGDAISILSKGSQFNVMNRDIFSQSPTLHSGYVQALADSGYIGGLLYSLILLITCFMYWKQLTPNEFGAECFIVLFLSVANFAESILFKTSTWHSALFWYLVVSGFTLADSRLSTNKQNNQRNTVISNMGVMSNSSRI